MDKKLKRDLLIFFAIFGVLTIPFLIFDLDIILQKPYFTIDKGWFLMDVPFWDFIYKYSIFLGYFAAVIALIVVSVSYWKRSLIKWRKAAYFMLFVVVLGPGVLVNATFKDHWGRPRPREIKEFNGPENYVKVLVKGDTGGKSFPCGHASIAFYLSIPFLFLRKRYKKLAWGFLISGTLYGLLVGYARMIAGGHFASDVLWAAGFVWLAGIIGYYLLKVGDEIDLDAIDDASQKRKGKIIAIIMGMVLPVLTVSLLLATPYISKRTFTQTKESLAKIEMSTLSARFTEGNIHVFQSEDFVVDYSVNAFGFPNSKITWNWIEGDTTIFLLKHLGWFTEVRNSINVCFPRLPQITNSIDLKQGKIYMEIPTDTLIQKINIRIQKGDIILMVNSESRFNLSLNNTNIQNNSSIELTNDNNAPLSLNINIQNGVLIIEDIESMDRN